MITTLSSFAAPCTAKGDFLGLFPTWYKYLDSVTNAAGVCSPKIGGINDLWLILAAVIEMLLRVAAIAALAFVVWGGIQFITSQGEPERTHKAQGTIINALIGLVISVGAATIVTFIAGKF